MHATTADLFEHPAVDPFGRRDAGVGAFDRAFDAWMAERRADRSVRQLSSEKVYRSMWGAFMRWAVARGLRLRQIDATDLQAFLHTRADEAGFTDRHAWRWLTLIDAVLVHACQAAGEPANRAAADLLQSRPRWRFANTQDNDPLPSVLDDRSSAALVAWLVDPDSGYSAAGAPAGSWQALRNRASVALQLGAGLTPGDVRAATVAGARPPAPGGPPARWTLRIPRHGAVPPREVPVAPWAAALLRAWLDTRAALALPGPCLFPGAADGRAWAKVPQFTAATSVLSAAGIHRAGGSFVLRHTFAVRQLRRGHSAERVRQWLGVVDPKLMDRYRRLAPAPAPAPAPLPQD